MAWVDLTGRAGLPTAGDLNAYPGKQTRIVCWPQAVGSNDLIAYRNDLRPFTDAPAGPILVDFSGSFVQTDVLVGTLSGHVGGGGSRYVATLRRRHAWGRRTRRRT